MAVSAEEIAMSYPIQTYRFRVTVGNDEMVFKSVSGLSPKVQTVEYKDGLGNWFQLHGQRDAVNITLDRGIFKGKSEFWQWIQDAINKQADKRDITISLTNETGDELLVTYYISDAMITGTDGPSLDAASNEIAIEKITLLANRMTVEFH